MPIHAHADIKRRFELNVRRVRALVTTYESIVGVGRSGDAAGEADILRASVVLLHASLEDLLRSIEENYLLGTAPEHAFKRFNLFSPPAGAVEDKGKEKFTLQDLAAWRGHTVDEVFARAIDAYLDRSNWNNFLEVKVTLEMTGLGAAWRDEERRDLEAVMSRRHMIAHRADRNPKSGPGHDMPMSIDTATVLQWTAIIESLGRRVITERERATP